MKKYLNRLNRIEETILPNKKEMWIAWIDVDGTADLSSIHGTKKILTASEFEVFKKQRADEQILTVEWFE